jgi:hypothetical protein
MLVGKVGALLSTARDSEGSHPARANGKLQVMNFWASEDFTKHPESPSAERYAGQVDRIDLRR